MDDFFRGMATIGELSPNPNPLKKYPQQLSEWQGVANSFAQVGGNILTAMKEFPQNIYKEDQLVIKVISIGGGGANTINRMLDSQLSGVEFIAINTDVQDLYNKSNASIKLPIGIELTKGHGSGGKPETGEKAAIEDSEAISEVIKGADIVFIISKMGGGTGTGAAPVIAKIAKRMGALVIGIVTTPFEFEGRYKMTVAREGIRKLRAEADSLITIHNQNFINIINSKITLNEAFLLADEIIYQFVWVISELVDKNGFLNSDFSEMKTILEGKGDILFGIGFASGENRAINALNIAINNSFFDNKNIINSTGVIIYIIGPEDITLLEIKNILDVIKEKCNPNINLIHGLRLDSEIDDRIKVIVIASGFDNEKLTNNKITDNYVNIS